MNERLNHVTVCICTFRRPELLSRTLEALIGQETAERFSYDVVVSDNDQERSAFEIVSLFAQKAPIRIAYCTEPRQNIALARNLALAQAGGEFVAFIDDDEIPGRDWLLRLLETCERLSCDGVLGPVTPYFDNAPPQWIVKGGFFDRPNHPTGLLLHWTDCRTGNVLFRRAILHSEAEPFRSQFGTGGEDTDFFHRMSEHGFQFLWCAEAPVRELVPPFRCRRRFLLKRALLRGSNFSTYPAERAKNIGKSLLAVPLYTLALPVLAVLGHHLLMRYLVKLCDHAARLVSLGGIALVKERET